MMKIDLKPGEKIDIGDNISIILETKSGKVARLSIDAPKETPINHKKGRSSVVEHAAKLGLGS